MHRLARLTGTSGLALSLGLLALTSAHGRAQAPAAAAPTFTKDVLPILQRSCQKCHRPGTAAPMSLLTYQDARPWARSIRNKVTLRQMPPWHIDRSIGEYLEDPSLSDAEIATITRWVDEGTAQGRRLRTRRPCPR